jgi:hypothetical protein
MALSPADIKAKIAESKAPKTRKKPWVAPTVDDIAYGSVLAFDQTLSNTGVAWVVHDHDGLRAIECTNLVQSTTHKGHEGSIRKGEMLHHHLFWDMKDSIAGLNADVFVYEQPPVQGYRIESSLLAAMMVRLVWPHAVPISNQHAKSIFIPPGSTGGKGDVKKAVEALIPNWQRTGPWNQHIHDAVLLGLTYLHDVKKEMDRV